MFLLQILMGRSDFLSAIDFFKHDQQPVPILPPDSHQVLPPSRRAVGILGSRVLEAGPSLMAP